jgi:hypothetical protein
MILHDVIEIRAAIEEYLDLNLSIQTAYKFTKFLLETENDYDFFVSKTKEIINKYAEKDENGEIIFNEEGVRLSSSTIEEAEAALRDLSFINVSIGDYFSFNIDEFEGLKMSCRKMRLFIPFIKN